MCFVLSLFIVYLFFLGCVSGVFRAEGDSPFARAAVTIAVGILLNYSLTLTGLAMSGVLIAGSVIGLGGLLRFAGEMRRRLDWRLMRSRTTWLAAGCVVYVVALYYFAILSEPLIRWDARSVWFFHAKMIWAAGALRHAAGWSHPSVAFASPDYPNLVPAMAAQLASAIGYWNEFVPKASLLVMLVPLVLWVISFAQRGLSFPLLFALFCFSLHGWLWNGYMDGYFSLYCGMACLALGRYAHSQRPPDLYSGVCALGIAASLKNEGLLFAASAIAGLLVVGVRLPEVRVSHLLSRLRHDRVFFMVLLIALAPTLLWTTLKQVWGLENQLIGVAGTLGRAWQRLCDGVTPPYLLRFLTARATVIWLLVPLLVLASSFARYQRPKLHPGAIITSAITAIYFCGIFAIYLSTPANLTWHLSTSATRVMATVSLGLLIAIYFVLSQLETPSSTAV